MVRESKSPCQVSGVPNATAPTEPPKNAGESEADGSDLRHDNALQVNPIARVSSPQRRTQQ